jgi:predicted transposase YdaD
LAISSLESALRCDFDSPGTPAGFHPADPHWFARRPPCQAAWSVTPKPHDATFKFLFGEPEHAAALVRHSLPSSIASRIDWSTMSREPTSFIDDQLGERYSDLLFSVVSNRGRVFIYLLIEHQSTNDPNMPLRLLEYMVRIWVDQRKRESGPLAPILPLLISHAPGGWTSPRRLDELFDPDPDFAPFIPSFELPIQDLQHLTNDEIKAWSMGACQQLALWMLRDSRTAQRFLDNLPEWREQFEDAASSANGLDTLVVLFRYIMKVNEGLSLDEIHAKIHQLAPAAERAVMTIEEQLLQEGARRGRAEGRVEMLMHQLVLKFGELAEQHRTRLTRATLGELDVWAERVLGATTLDEVFAE